MRLAAIVASLVCALSPARSLWAQEPEETAASAFQRASVAYERGDYGAAAQAFALAYSLRPHAAALFNQARALERVGDAPHAADAYELALAREELRAQDQAECEVRLALLARTLGSVLITGPAQSRGSIGSLEQAALPIRAHLATGRYELSLVRRDGQRATVLVSVAAGKLTELRIPEQGPPWPSPMARTTPLDDRLRAWSVPTSAYATAAAAVVATGAGIYLGLAGLEARDQFDASQHTDQDAHDRAVRLRATANVAFAVGFAAVATTGLLVYRAARAPVRVSLRTANNARIGQLLDLTVSGRF